MQHFEQSGNHYTDILQRLTRLETKLDMILDQMKSQDTNIKSLTTRVEALEKSKAKAVGVFAVVAGIVGYFGSLLSSALAKLF